MYVEDMKNLVMTHPLYEHLQKMIEWANIRNPISNYADQKSI